MIKFPCMCRFQLEVPDELAGGLIQCPHCSRLCDVPSLSDLGHLQADGTIELQVLEEAENPEEIARINRAFNPRKLDDTGNEIDLRLSPEELAEVGAPPEPDLVAPKYDPVTGELVRPLEIKEDPDLPDGPIPVARAALTYSTDRVLHRLSAGRILLELFMPVNVFVMFFVYVGHILPAVVSTVIPPHPIAAVLALIVIVFPVTVLVLSHYANTIEDVGPDGHDELQRPLRNVALWEDLMGPFGRVALALILCYGLTMGALRWDFVPSALRSPAAWTTAFIGTMLLPAVLLTTTTSGTFLNLRPDRVLGLIRACGGDYVFAAVGSFVTMGVYFWNAVGLFLMPDSWFVKRPWLVHLGNPLVNFVLLALAVYLGHFFCWYLGLLYRRHHGQFPWALQRHIPKPRPVPRRAVVRPAIDRGA